MSYSIRDLAGIDEHTAFLLRSVGIRTTAGLLEAAKDSRGRKLLAVRTGLSEQFLLDFANLADRLRIRGMGADYAELVREAGVKTVRDLKHRNAKRLAAAIEAANEKRGLVRHPPTERQVRRWIEEARTLDIKISY